MSLRSALRTCAVVAPTLVAALALSACGGPSEADAADGADGGAAAGEAVTVEHAQGTTELEGVPEKVFVFDWASASVLDALGVEIDGVPKEGAPEAYADLAGDEDVVDVGTLFEPDYETVAAEAPDLIVVGGRSAAVLPELEKIAPTIDMSNDWADNVASSTEHALALGEVFGKQDEAQALVNDLEASIADVQEQTTDAGDALIALTTGGEVTAYGAGGRFGFLHDSLGFTPAAEISEEEQHGQAISFEYILDTDPDWLFVIDRDTAIGQGSEAAQQVFDNDVIAQTSAAKNDRIVYVDPTPWYILGGGVVALQQIADEVSGELDDEPAEQA